MLPGLFTHVGRNEVIIGCSTGGDSASGHMERRHRNFNNDPLGVVRMWFAHYPLKPVINYRIH